MGEGIDFGFFNGACEQQFLQVVAVLFVLTLIFGKAVIAHIGKLYTDYQQLMGALDSG